ncbi:hypothetical protein AX15_004778 [Amanita polypyramis BW_CC]|nr:hypothetical protein AX15_004778 [Amanita polypyramis BW_CC]
MSYMRPRHWPGYEKISGSDGQWSITFALQGSFDCPTPHISFDLFHRRVPERDDNAEHPAIQPCQEGRWHVYHILIEGSEDEMKEVEAGQKRLGGAAYDWRMTMLLHESKPLNRRLVDKILRWQLSSAGVLF